MLAVKQDTLKKQNTYTKQKIHNWKRKLEKRHIWKKGRAMVEVTCVSVKLRDWDVSFVSGTPTFTDTQSTDTPRRDHHWRPVLSNHTSNPSLHTKHLKHTTVLLSHCIKAECVCAAFVLQTWMIPQIMCVVEESVIRCTISTKHLNYTTTKKIR